ncbi:MULTISPECIES: NADH:flavin oxidoreductase/NADH oxidase [Nocardiopsis]|uniref:2,4-dienoyl-CoA reductase-like NADH-dependent reductase (Old Yellow Enzyme family) n=1 Tax=Nocardiopsis sinuspersici TaxID=501010 RepID=A0A1V3C0B5_9ACTN|nr:MULTISPECIES: NADH:flavin oxidoreductase/NADH oxidase [Nocardiopsis]NYH55703.1 2,4-dienoyl-CoA reductase-like NADH-dependent reductase (Old Yellow Enzyme family) [Nocardiopsis sinuspersici]OOC54257.1 oxidoreductase [Nocardiopsis sinuspersici]
MSSLFTPLTLRSLTIPNRVWMSPMCMYSAASEGDQAGAPTDFHLAHLADRALGGAGLVMAEATGVRPDGRISPWDLGLWNDQQQEAFSRVTAAIRSHGSVAAVQLAHAGRKASTNRPWLGGGHLTGAEGGWETVSPSAEAFSGLSTPHELTEAEIDQLVADFAASAERALAAGFQVAEVHGAHGYLLHSFLSPAANHRTDAYGGGFENRTRFPLRVVEAVREVWPEDLPVFFRVSATDWLSEDAGDTRRGWTGDDTVLLAKELQARGVDLLDVSTGGVVHDARIPVGPDYQVPFAARARQEAGVPTSAVGLVTDPRQAEEIVASGRADAVMLGRQLLREPYWAHRAAAELGARPAWPEQYGYAV